jgi:cation diffusion facilitator CzcD-associated flavoprotein CzcO
MPINICATIEFMGAQMTRILVLGAGFAGLWAAVAAARKLDESTSGR